MREQPLGLGAESLGGHYRQRNGTYRGLVVAVCLMCWGAGERQVTGVCLAWRRVSGGKDRGVQPDDTMVRTAWCADRVAEGRSPCRG